MYADGRSDTEICNQLYISPFTVGNHRKHIMQKLNLHTKADIVAWALNNQIV
jgi:two-component system response regulator NreC